MRNDPRHNPITNAIAVQRIAASTATRISRLATPVRSGEKRTRAVPSSPRTAIGSESAAVMTQNQDFVRTYREPGPLTHVML